MIGYVNLTMFNLFFIVYIPFMSYQIFGKTYVEAIDIPLAPSGTSASLVFLIADRSICTKNIITVMGGLNDGYWVNVLK